MSYKSGLIKSLTRFPDPPIRISNNLRIESMINEWINKNYEGLRRLEIRLVFLTSYYIGVNTRETQELAVSLYGILNSDFKNGTANKINLLEWIDKQDFNPEENKLLKIIVNIGVGLSQSEMGETMRLVRMIFQEDSQIDCGNFLLS